MEHRSHRIRNLRSRNSDNQNDLESEMLAPVRAPSPLVVRPSVRSLPEIGDRRRWAPTSPGLRPRVEVRDVLGRPARVKVQPKTSAKALAPAGVTKSRWSYVQRWRPERAVFAAPRNVKICIQRKNRREVLFALKRTLKGYNKPKRRSYYSNVHCPKGER